MKLQKDLKEFIELLNSVNANVADGIPVHFISRDLLIRNKRATGRVRDLADAEEIAGEE